MEETTEKTLFNGLRAYSRGKITKDELQEYDDTNTLYVVKELTPKGESIIEFEFDSDEELLKSLCLEEDDIWFARSVSSSYSNYEFEDSYQMLDDFKQGYNIWWDLSEENIEKAKKIAKYIKPDGKFNLDSNDSFLGEFCNKLYDTFPREIDDIVEDYTSYKNQEIVTTADISINKELDDALADNNFKFQSKWYKIRTTVSNLIWLIAKDGFYDLNIKDILNGIYCRPKYRLGGWDENRFEFRDDANFDTNSFNRSVERNFDNILEKIEENEEYKEYSEIIEYLHSKFDFNKWYPLPKLPEKFEFKVVRVDFDSLKIIVNLKKKSDWRTKTLGFDFDSFKKFLYLPELFDLSDIYSIE